MIHLLYPLKRLQITSILLPDIYKKKSYLFQTISDQHLLEIIEYRFYKYVSSVPGLYLLFL